MFGSTTKSLIRLSVMVIVMLSLCALASDSALAQCVMCKASLSGNSAFAKNLNIGVLVLLVPPVSIFCTIFILAIRHRKSG
jgi:hypothetical protein